MEQHRIRTCPSIDGKPKPHIFVELETDSWLEVKERPTHDAIHRFLKKEEEAGEFDMRFATRYFKLFDRDWIEEGAIS